MTRVRSLGTGAALFLFALAVRALPASTVLSGKWVQFSGTASYEHLRRIRYAVENFPTLLDVDVYQAFPQGASAPWPPLFDVVLAIVLAPFAWLGGPDGLERAAAWVPPILGAATVVAVWQLGRRCFGDRIGLGAGLFLAVLGGHFSDTQLGALTPSAATSLAAAVLLAATMAALSARSARAWLGVGLTAALTLLLSPDGALLAALALGALLVDTLPSDSRSDRLRRLGLALGAFTLVAGGGFLLLPWSGSLADAWTLVVGGARPVFRGTGAEALPLFGIGASFDGRVAERSLSYLVYVFPLALSVGLGEALGAERRGPLLFLVVSSAILFAASVYERRFLDAFAVAFALTNAWAVGALAGRLRVGGSDASGVVGLVLLVLLLPLRSNYVPHLRNWIAGAGAPPELSRTARIDRIRYGVAAWLAANSPPTPGWLGGPGSPAYGVLAPEEAGPTLRYVGRRPTVVGGAGSGSEAGLGARFWSSPPADAYRMLEERGARFVVVRAGDRRGRSWPRGAIYRTLARRHGSAAADDPTRSAAGRLRLLYESAPLKPGPTEPPLYRLFLLVKGARIEGRARPDADLRLELELLSHDVRPLSYVDHARADADGRFRFLVPYANEQVGGRVQAVGSYTLSCGYDAIRVSVDDRQVRRGEVVAVPDPCSRAPTGASGAPPPAPAR